MIYPHGTRHADQHIADALTRRIEAEATGSDAGSPSREQHAAQSETSDNTGGDQAEFF